LPVETPTLRTAHYVKKSMDQELEPYRNAVTGRLDLDNAPDAQSTNRVRGAWGEAMRKVSKPYNQAMDQWGDDSDHMEAFKLGGSVLSDTFDMQSEQVGRVFAGMSQEARLEFSKGVGEAILRKVRGAGGGVGAMRALLKNEDVAAKVRLAFPTAESFDDFMERAAGRVAHEDRNRQVWGNSRTFARAAAADDLALDDDALDAAIDAATLNVRGLGEKGIKAMLGKKGRSVMDDEAANMDLARAVTTEAGRDNLLRMLRLQQARSIAARLPSAATRHLAAPVGVTAGGRER
jgi:hypothetical protein